MTRALSAALLVGALAPGAAASAQPREEPPSEAVEYYRSGRAHYAAGRYREAIVDLERARLLDPESPTLIFNLARVYELLGELDRAILFYREYVRMLPASEAEARERAEEAVGRLEGARATMGGAPPRPVTGPPGDEESLDAPVFVEEHGVADVVFWLAAGTSAALLVTGLGVGAWALAAEADAEALQPIYTPEDAEALEIAALNADDRALIADVLIGLSVAAGVGAALLYGLRTHMVETRPTYGGTQAFADVGARGAMVGVRGAL